MGCDEWMYPSDNEGCTEVLHRNLRLNATYFAKQRELAKCQYCGEIFGFNDHEVEVIYQEEQIAQADERIAQLRTEITALEEAKQEAHVRLESARTELGAIKKRGEFICHHPYTEYDQMGSEWCKVCDDLVSLPSSPSSDAMSTTFQKNN